MIKRFYCFCAKYDKWIFLSILLIVVGLIGVPYFTLSYKVLPIDASHDFPPVPPFPAIDRYSVLCVLSKIKINSDVYVDVEYFWQQYLYDTYRFYSAVLYIVVVGVLSVFTCLKFIKKEINFQLLIFPLAIVQLVYLLGIYFRIKTITGYYVDYIIWPSYAFFINLLLLALVVFMTIMHKREKTKILVSNI